MTDSSANTEPTTTEPTTTDSAAPDSAGLDGHWIRCDQEMCDTGEDCGDNGWHRVVEWWDGKCDNCDEWGCAYHYMHVADCSCLLEDWVPERLVTWI